MAGDADFESDKHALVPRISPTTAHFINPWYPTDFTEVFMTLKNYRTQAACQSIPMRHES
mgnify:CR=1 FL=1